MAPVKQHLQVLTANATPGSYSVLASVAGLNSTAPFPLTNTPRRVTSIAISAMTPSLVNGSTEQFTATGIHSDGSTANITTQVAWASSSSAVATISTSGFATAVAVGSAEITASLSGVTSNSFALTVILVPPVLTAITVTAPTNSLMVSAMEQFTATGVYRDGSTANLTAQVAWASSSSAIAAVRPSGLASALAVGSTNITASLSGVTSNSFALTVTPPLASAPTVVSYSVLFGSQSYNVLASTRNRLPWQITGIRVVFSQPIISGTSNSLGGLSVAGFSGLGTTTLTWTISPLSVGSEMTSLSGSGSNALTNASGVPLNDGSGFSQMLKVLWGDFNDDGFVTASDLVGVNDASALTYDVLADENGDGL